MKDVSADVVNTAENKRDDDVQSPLEAESHGAVSSVALAPTALPPSAVAEQNTQDSGGDSRPDFVWLKDAPPGPQTRDLCKLLAKLGTLYQTPGGRLVQLRPGMEPRFISDPTDLEAVIRENLRIIAMKNGKIAGNSIPSNDLKVLLRSRVLMEHLPTVDRITEIPTYTGQWKLTQPGFNDGEVGNRFFYTGEAVTPKREPTLIRKFIDAMSFKSLADAVNAVAFALTVLLRHMWRGEKPFVPVTSNKSHGGKDTVVTFAAGRTKSEEISWHYHDWATQNEAVTALADDSVGLVIIGNIRSEGSSIESAFVERTVTSGKSRLQSSKRRGDGYVRDGDFVICATANNGRFSVDLANRSLPIHLELVGDVSHRRSPIGDPRHEFLPQHRAEIEAELLGLVETWKENGRPTDTTVQHPMRAWAATIGGILKANGLNDFLTNWSIQRGVNDAVREAIGLLAIASEPDRWLRLDSLVRTAVDEGVIQALMEQRHRASHRSMMRQLGVVLTAHRDETLSVETDDGIKSFILRRDRNTQCGGQLATVYRFETAAEAAEGTAKTTEAAP